MNLYDFQRKILDDLYAWFERNLEGHPIIWAPTGSGKSHIIAHLASDANDDRGSRTRILIVTPSAELCQQNLEKLTLINPGLRIGVVSAALGRKDFLHDKDIVIGTILSMHRHADRYGVFDLAIIDEAHQCNRANIGSYRQLIGKLMSNNSALRVIGMTATPFRGNGVWLHAGEDRLFTDIAARVDMKDLLQSGYLAPVISGKSALTISSDGLEISNGDYKINQIAERLDRDEIIRPIVADIIRQGQDRRRWMIFCTTVAHAKHVCWEFIHSGIPAAVVTGETAKADRRQIVEDFRKGKYRALCNVTALTTGFDVPEIDLLAWVRNTRSPVLFVQGVGRGMRVADGKSDCLFLDYTDTSMMLGPVDLIKGRPEPKPKEQKAPFKLCDECGASNPAGARECIACGSAFPDPTPHINTEASGAQILSTHVSRFETFPVDRVSWQRKISKASGLPYLQVNFESDLDVFHQNFMIEHEGYARERSLKDFAKLLGFDSRPASINQAINVLENLPDAHFERIDSITVDMASKWKNVVRVNCRDKKSLVDSNAR